MATAPVADPAHLQSLVHRHRHAIAQIAARHGAHEVRLVGLVGSVARGDHRATSDIYLLVTLEPGRSLLDLAALHDELVALLGVEVSILTSGCRIGRDPQVLADATAL
jgi:predicted nucleotidyltransferase